MSKTTIGSFKGGSKGLTYSHGTAYAYSGIVTCDNTATTMLDFMTDKNCLKAKFVMGYDTESADNMEFLLSYNNVTVYAVTLEDRAKYTPFNSIDLIIPPNTAVKVTCQNIETSGGRDMTASITGVVYG
jgi:hypothetical protein